MKQIDKIARELKSQFAGCYNDYYKSVTIYLDTDDDCLYAKYWEMGESWIKAPKHLIPLTQYEAAYGNWGDSYGNDNNWSLTKRAIAGDIKAGLRDLYMLPDFYGKVTVPQWLSDEVEFYTMN